MQTASEPKSNSSKRLSTFFVSRNFALLWAAQATSSFGEYVLGSTVTVWLVLDLARDDPLLPTYIGAVVLASSLPRLLVAPFAGVWVDRWHAKRTMVSADLTRAMLFVPIILISILSQNRFVLIIGVLLLLLTVAVLSQFFNPARAATMQIVIPENRRVDASSKSIFSGLGVAVVATMLGPGLYAVVGAVPAMLINMFTFLVSAVLILLTRQLGKIPAVDAAVASYWSRFRSGIVVAWQVRPVRLVLVGVGLYGISLGVNNAVLSLFALKTLGLSATQYGIVAAMFSVGGLIATIFAVPILKKIGSERIFSIAILFLGACYMGYALTTGFWTAAVVMFLCGVGFAVYIVAQGPILQAATPIGFMGRITAVSVPILALSSVGATVLASQIISAAALHAVNLGSTLDARAYAIAIFVAAVVLFLGGAAMVIGQRIARRKGVATQIAAQSL